MQASSIDCDLCDTVLRECVRVPHFDSKGLFVTDKIFCLQCWECWRNKRLNLDSNNPYGVQGMTCPHCQKSLSSESSYRHDTIQPHIYSVIVGTHSFPVTAYTKIDTFKRDILWSMPYNDIDEFDLCGPIHHPYLNTPSGTVLTVVPRPKTRTIYIQIYPCPEPFAIDVYETSIFTVLKQSLSKLDPILFDTRTGIEFTDTRMISSYDNLGIIAVMPRQLHGALYAL
jgi:hypothetical protein